MTQARGAEPAGAAAVTGGGTPAGAGAGTGAGADVPAGPAAAAGAAIAAGAGTGAEPGAVGARIAGAGAGAGALVGTEPGAAGLPGWLEPVAAAARQVRPEQLGRFLPPDGGGRPSAVLILFGEGEHGPDLLLIERSAALRSHAGQPSFPGGALDPVDGDPEGDGPVRAALREAEEETGLDPLGVQVFGVLPRLYIPVSGFTVTPVLGWWREPSPVRVVDPAETARVFRVPVSDLTDPANRATVVHPSGFRGPAFQVGGALVWGFTGGLIDKLLHYAGWERPWDRERSVAR